MKFYRMKSCLLSGTCKFSAIVGLSKSDLPYPVGTVFFGVHYGILA